MCFKNAGGRPDSFPPQTGLPPPRLREPANRKQRYEKGTAKQSGIPQSKIEAERRNSPAGAGSTHTETRISTEAYTKHYFPDSIHMKASIRGRSSLVVDMRTGEAVYESVKRRPLLSVMNRLHYNPGR